MLARLIVVLLFSYGVVGHGAGVSCRASPSRLICSSRAVGRGVSFSSRGASRGRIGIDDVPVAVAWLLATPGAASRLVVSWSGGRLLFLSPAEVDWRRFSSCRLGGGACLP